MDLAGSRCYIQASLRWTDCKICGIAVEQVPWAPARSSFTYCFEDVVAWLVREMSKTAVSKLVGVDWKTVGRIIERVVQRCREPIDLTNLTAISVDEISYRKGHRYLTLVIDIEKGRVVWGNEGKSAESLKAFFDEIGEEACAKIKHAAIDMGKAFIKAITENLPNARIVFDRFHVQAVVSGAVDEVRREEWRCTTKGSPERKALKRSRYALLKNPWNLTTKQEMKLASLQETNKRIYRAYLLKESFADIFRSFPIVQEAEMRMSEWLGWASRSKLKPFVKAATTIREHLGGILAYFETGFTTGISEGFNNKARLATRRAYGFHSPQAALAMIELTCTGLEISLPHRRPKLQAAS